MGTDVVKTFWRNLSGWERAICSGRILWGFGRKFRVGKVAMVFLSSGVQRILLELDVIGWGDF